MERREPVFGRETSSDPGVASKEVPKQPIPETPSEPRPSTFKRVLKLASIFGLIAIGFALCTSRDEVAGRACTSTKYGVRGEFDVSKTWKSIYRNENGEAVKRFGQQVYRITVPYKGSKNEIECYMYNNDRTGLWTNAW